MKNKLGFFQKAFHPQAEALLKAVATLPTDKKMSDHIADIFAGNNGKTIYSAKEADYLLKSGRVSQDAKDRLRILRKTAEALEEISPSRNQKSRQGSNLNGLMRDIISFRKAEIDRDTFLMANGAMQYLTRKETPYLFESDRADALKAVAEHYSAYANQFSDDSAAYFRNKSAAIDAFTQAAKSYDRSGRTSQADEMLKLELSTAESSGIHLKHEAECAIRQRLNMSAPV